MSGNNHNDREKTPKNGNKIQRLLIYLIVLILFSEKRGNIHLLICLVIVRNYK